MKNNFSTFDLTLINILIDIEVQAGNPDKDIIQVVRAKYRHYLVDQMIGDLIWARRKLWIKKLLQGYHGLDTWGIPAFEWDQEAEIPEPGYKIYKDVPEGYILKLVLDEALIKYGQVDPKLRALLVMRYVEDIPATNKEIMDIFDVSKQTIYNWLDKGYEDLAKLLTKN